MALLLDPKHCNSSYLWIVVPSGRLAMNLCWGLGHEAATSSYQPKPPALWPGVELPTHPQSTSGAPWHQGCSGAQFRSSGGVLGVPRLANFVHCLVLQIVVVFFCTDHWPSQEPKLEVPTIYKAYIRPKFQGISQQNMAKHMVRLRTSICWILEISHWPVRSSKWMRLLWIPTESNVHHETHDGSMVLVY